MHRHYIDQWENFHDNVYENNEPHTNENFKAYLTWYRGATRTKLKVQWTQTDYADITSSDDEQTSYDLATRVGTQVECAPILDQVVITPIIYIPWFSCIGTNPRLVGILFHFQSIYSGCSSMFCLAGELAK